MKPRDAPTQSGKGRLQSQFLATVQRLKRKVHGVEKKVIYVNADTHFIIGYLAVKTIL